MMASKKNARKRVKAKVAAKAAAKAGRVSNGSDYQLGKFATGRVVDRGVRR